MVGRRPLSSPSPRAALRKLEYLGYTDAFRARHAEAGQYTFSGITRAGSWRKNQGIRIDHILLSPRRRPTA